MSPLPHQHPVWPEGKAFAFTVLDDSDLCSVANSKAVYDFLASCGLRTTLTVWPLAAEHPDNQSGATLADGDYLDFLLGLKSKGFGIGFHGATCQSSLREKTIEGIERFRSLLGGDPPVHANHHNNRENIYWGVDRLHGRLWRAIYRAATVTKARQFEGHDPQSPYFWGDLCHRHTTYVRNFVFEEINTLKINPTMPYHDPSRPYVRFWFSSAEGRDVARFCNAIRPERQARLEQEGGACILYTHFAFDFVRNGALNAEFRRLVELLAARNGWFVPVRELLDYLREQGGGGNIPEAELRAMERRWMWEKIRHGSG
jgi:hypothetical protein